MSKNYAVLISGGLAQDGYDEFWNDLVLMWKALLDVGYRDENIFVVYGDGNDFDDPARPYYSFKRFKLLNGSKRRKLTDFRADIESISYLFNSLTQNLKPSKSQPDRIPDVLSRRIINKLSSKDTLFVWTFDHGDKDGANSSLCLMNGEKLSDIAFGNLIAKIKCAFKTVVMQQCFSGGFIDNLSDGKTMILTACSHDEAAHRCDSENNEIDGVVYHHGEFNHQFLQAFYDKSIRNAYERSIFSVDFISMKTIFNSIFQFIYDYDSAEETPQYFDGNGMVAADYGSNRPHHSDDMVKTAWSVGDVNGGFSVEFSYSVSNFEGSLASQIIKVDVLVDGCLRETHNISLCSNSLMLNIPPSRNHYGLFGTLCADYTQKNISFNGNIIPKKEIYCGQNYSPYASSG
ncbi:MAG TPA: C13 family peptidase, partial [Clostridia bacterium]|nr:C13 family peptidase [Clostridia bacterium]